MIIHSACSTFGGAPINCAVDRRGRCRLDVRSRGCVYSVVRLGELPMASEAKTGAKLKRLGSVRAIAIKKVS